MITGPTSSPSPAQAASAVLAPTLHSESEVGYQMEVPVITNRTTSTSTVYPNSGYFTVRIRSTSFDCQSSPSLRWLKREERMRPNILLWKRFLAKTLGRRREKLRRKWRRIGLTRLPPSTRSRLPDRSWMHSWRIWRINLKRQVLH